jgi:hypothetical protein
MSYTTDYPLAHLQSHFVNISNKEKKPTNHLYLFLLISRQAGREGGKQEAIVNHGGGTALLLLLLLLFLCLTHIHTYTYIHTLDLEY